MEADLDVRPSPIAGQWYPAESRRLASSVDQYINAARPPEIEGEVVAVMAPHAGHLFSGPVAGYAFAALRGLDPEVVAIASPMHYPYAQPLLTSAHAAYQTPLGIIPIDQEAVRTLNECLRGDLGFGLSPVYNDPEHSLEIELPFLQRVISKQFSLVPVMVRDQTARVARSLGSALAETLQDRSSLLVASTDLSHFYTQEVAEELDAEVLRQVEALDPEGVLRVEEQGKGFACGRAALAAVLWAAKDLGANSVKVLHYATSGDVTGDFLRVVGYAAAVVTRKLSLSGSSSGS
ncbi:MAG TPA: AmmeMemoRadiSam system protein B [Anaerolineales bacterium]|jgi:AmmeMemoRadiSam system protein B|nr:AmmeMemoRadiSam system protein B [Anaerolineales bacterium]